MHTQRNTMKCLWFALLTGFSLIAAGGASAQDRLHLRHRSRGMGDPGGQRRHVAGDRGKPRRVPGRQRCGHRPAQRGRRAPQFLGDWSALGVSDTLSFDVYFINSGTSTLTGSWIFHLSGPGGAAGGIVPGPAPPESIWSTYAIPVDSTDWVVESGSWSGLMNDVTSLKLLVEYVNGAEEVRIDNVRLTGVPADVFTTCVYSDFNGTGLDDWSFQGTGSTGNPGNGEGNGAGSSRSTTGPPRRAMPSPRPGSWGTGPAWTGTAG